MSLSDDDIRFLQEAARFFENPGSVAKVLMWAGKPVEAMHNRLPEKAKDTIAVVTESAIKKAFVAAVRTLPDSAPISPENQELASALSSRTHRRLTTLTGVAGGLIGLPSLAIELPVTTVLILRAISDQARLYGHDLSDIETRLECLLVFTMGIPDEDGKLGEFSAGHRSISNYFMTRASFVSVMKRAATSASALGTKELLSSIEKGTSPVLVRMISSIAKKFQIRVSQKFVAESVPLIGAIGGGALNYAFTDFFVRSARYHFRIRALEKKYGEDVIQAHLGQI